MKKLSLVFLLVIFSFAKASANNFFFSPGISVGYTFGAGTNWGFFFDMGMVNQILEEDIKYGLSFSWYYVSVQSTASRHYTHRIRSLSCLMAENDFIDLKFGFGRAKNPWGTGNRCIVQGTMADISFTYPNSFSPWIGFKTLRYNRADWAWFDKPYNTVYVKYKYDIIQNTDLRKL